MKRWFALLALSAAGVFVGQEISLGQGPAAPKTPAPFSYDLGPGSQGAVLTQPSLSTGNFAPPLETNRPAPPPTSLQTLWPQQQGGPNFGPPLLAAQRIALPPTNNADVNKDIEVAAGAGPWLILVMTYSGEKAPWQARNFVVELRGKYKLNAYVYNYGAEEKRKEYERAEAERARQREDLRKSGLTADLPIRVRVAKIEEQTGVLIGGYRNRDEALNDLRSRIRKLAPPDPKKVDLHLQYIGMGEEDKASRYPFSKITVDKKIDKQAQIGYLNPFLAAFPVHNPFVKEEQTPENAAEDVAYLRKINLKEPLSLFHCKKPYTLLIKQYKTAMVMNDNPNDAKGFLERIANRKGDWDPASQNAHNVAEGFLKAGLPEMYVLHAKYCSYVTVGGYDSPEDPRMMAMQNLLEGRFRLDALRPLDLMARPIPMEVPR